MNYIDFCFWLQGYFELGQPNTIDSDTLDVIRDHLNLATAHQKEASLPPPEKTKLFCEWLQSDLAQVNSGGPRYTKTIKAELDDVFVHEIDGLKDTETTLDPDVAQFLHDGESGNDQKMRC